MSGTQKNFIGRKIATFSMVALLLGFLLTDRTCFDHSFYCFVDNGDSYLMNTIGMFVVLWIGGVLGYLTSYKHARK